MSAVDNTGELRKLAFEIQQARTRVADRGAVAITIMIAFVVAIWTFAVADTDRFNVDASRWIMAAATVGTAVTAIGVGAWWLDKRNRNRTNEIVGRLDALCSVACHNATAHGQLAAQMEQLDQRFARLAAMFEPEPEQVPAGQVHAMTAEAYRLGRRSRPAES